MRRDISYPLSCSSRGSVPGAGLQPDLNTCFRRSRNPPIDGAFREGVNPFVQSYLLAWGLPGLLELPPGRACNWSIRDRQRLGRLADRALIGACGQAEQNGGAYRE